jgi:hypothetical protein
MTETMNRIQEDNNEVQHHSEGPIARKIEEQTARIPSDVFLWAALGSMGLSLGLRVAGMKEHSQFVGHWASPLLILGLYNKIVKVSGSDRTHAPIEK